MESGDSREGWGGEGLEVWWGKGMAVWERGWTS